MRKHAEKEGTKTKRQYSELRKNALFGKSTENPLNETDLKIVTSRKQYLKWLFRPTFRRKTQIPNGSIVIEKEKFRIRLNKPIYIGAVILESSKKQ